MSAATAGSVCLANPAVLPRPIEPLGSPYQSKPSPGSTEIFADQHIFRNFQTSLLNGPIIEPSVARIPDVVLSSKGRATLGLADEFPR